MAYEPEVRVVRELIRQVLREQGFRHESANNCVWTVCYAQQPTASVQYLGPFRFELRGAGVQVFHYRPAPFTGLRPNPLMSAAMIAALEGRTVRNLHGVYVFREHCQTSPEQTTLELSAPDFDRTLARLVCAAVPAANRRPAPWKRLRVADGWEHVVPDVQPYSRLRTRADDASRTLWQTLWAMFGRWRRRWCGEDPADPWKDRADERLWLEHALRRHFRAEPETVREFLMTVAALREAAWRPTELERETLGVFADHAG